MKCKKIWSTLLATALCAALLLSGCTSTSDQSSASAQNVGSVVSTDDYAALPGYVSLDEDDLNENWNTGTVTEITLSGSGVTVSGNGVSVNGATVTITSPGTYHISGTLSDGQIVVDSAADGNVWLVLDGANITCSNSAPLYIKSADNTILTLAEGSENSLTDGAVYENLDADNEPNAALFSKDDLTINGGGSLTVNGNYNNGIQSKDDLRIVNGTVTVTAVNDGVKGKDKLGIFGGVLNVTSGSNALRSDNETEADMGRVYIAGGTITAVATGDAVDAEHYLLVTGGALALTSGGGSENAPAKTEREAGRFTGGGFADGFIDSTDTSNATSGKGLKADVDVTLLGGTIAADCADDAVHSNGDVTIDGADLTISTGDDGVHADGTASILSGNLDILRCYEGIEGVSILLAGGDISVVADDDGVNANGDEFSGSSLLTISGGTIHVNAAGDGIDSNGAVVQTGGNVYVDGPINDGNGALDYTTTYVLSGGVLVAAGSSGMAMSLSDSSTIYSVLAGWDSQQSAGSTVTLTDADGNTVLEYAPGKSFSSIVLASPDIKQGASYTVSCAGVELGSFTASSACSTVGNIRSMGSMGGGFGKGGMTAPDGSSGATTVQPPDGTGTPPTGTVPDGSTGAMPQRPGQDQTANEATSGTAT